MSSLLSTYCAPGPGLGPLGENRDPYDHMSWTLPHYVTACAGCWLYPSRLHAWHTVGARVGCPVLCRQPSEHRRGPDLRSLTSVSCSALGSSEGGLAALGSATALEAFLESQRAGWFRPSPGSSCQHLCLPLESSLCRFGPDVCKDVSWQPEVPAGAARPDRDVSLPVPRVEEEWRCSAGLPCTGFLPPALWIRLWQ